MALFRTALTIAILALLAPFIYDRAQVLVGFYKNNPVRLSKHNALGHHDVKFADKIRSCEDALLIESAGVAILPCDPGRERHNTVMGFFIPGPVSGAELYLYDYKDGATPDSEALKRLELVDYAPGDDFHSLGIAFDEASSTLFVANHRHDGPKIEMFKLDQSTLQAKHIRSIAHPLIHGPNAIAIKNSNELFVTNDHHFTMAQSRFLAQAETYLALPLGTVVHVDVSDPDTTKATVVARVPFANGVELVNQTTLAVASSSKARVYLYDIVDNSGSTSAPELVSSSSIKLPYHVDNLSLTLDGRLLMAGHPHLPSLTKYAATRWICNDAAELDRADGTMKGYCATGQAASGASEWTEAGGLRHLYIDTEYPTSASATYDSERKVGIIAGLYAKGILREVQLSKCSIHSTTTTLSRRCHDGPARVPLMQAWPRKQTCSCQLRVQVAPRDASLCLMVVDRAMMRIQAIPARSAARLKFELVRESVLALDSAFFTTPDSTLFDSNFTSWTPTFTARSRPKYSPRALPHQHSNRTRAPRTTDCSLSSRAFSSPLIRAMPIPSSSQARGLKKSISMMFLRGRNQDAANPSTTLTTTTSSSTPTTITSFRASDNTDHCNTTNCKDHHCITHRNKMATTIEEQKELELAMREIISSQQKEIARLQGKNKEQEEEMDELRLVGHDQQALLERMTALAAARADENQSLRRDYQRLVDEHRRVVGEILSLPASLAGASPPPASAPASTELRARAAEAHQDIRRLAGELDAAAASVDDEKAKVQAIRDEVAAIKAKSAEMAGDNAALERDNEAKRLELAASAPAPAPARGAAPAAKNKKKKGKKAQK